MARAQAGKSRGTRRSAAVGITDGAGKLSGNNTVRIGGGKNRELQIRKVRPTEWTRTAESIFLRELAMTGNVRASAAAAGRSPCGAYRRRSRDPAFGAKWQAALMQGYERLEELLLATALESIGGGATSGGAIDVEADADEVGDGALDARKASAGNGGTDAACKAVETIEDPGEDSGEDSGDDAGDAPAARTVANRSVPKQAVPGAGLVKLSSVTAIQFALSMLNQHRADQLRGRNRDQTHRATSAETDAALGRLLDSLARRMARS